MAAQENLFGFDVDVEEVDKDGKPFKKEKKQQSGSFDKEEWKEWKKAGKHFHKATCKGNRGGGFGFVIALAAIAIFAIPGYVWAGIGLIVAWKIFKFRKTRAMFFCKS